MSRHSRSYGGLRRMGYPPCPKCGNTVLGKPDTINELGKNKYLCTRCLTEYSKEKRIYNL